jgi:hypothetical protein
LLAAAANWRTLKGRSNGKGSVVVEVAENCWVLLGHYDDGQMALKATRTSVVCRDKSFKCLQKNIEKLSR